MRRALHSNNTATAIITLIFIILSTLFTTSTAQTAGLRCQKSGCREGDNNDESSSPALIVTKPKSKLFPTLLSYITAFLLLRLGVRYMKKLLPILRDRLPQIRYMIGHYYHDSILSSSSTSNIDIRRVSRRRSSRDNSSYISLGSLAEFVDSDHSVGSTTIGEDEDDNDSYSTKSGYSTETGTSVGLSELLSDNDTTTNTKAFNSRRQLAGKRRGSIGSMMNAVASSAGTSYSSYDSEEDASTREGGGGGGTTISSQGSILSKFLNYITDPNNNATSSRHDQTTQRERNGIYGAQHNAHPKRRSSIDYSIFSSSNNNNSSNDIEKQRPFKPSSYYGRSNNGNDQQLSETATRQRPRRSTVDDSFIQHRSTSTYLTSPHHNVTKDKSSNASINNSGIKMRKNTVVASAVAKETPSQIINDGSDKKKVHQMQQQSKKKNDGNNNDDDDDDDDDDDKKKKKSSLHHHLSKFASSSSSSKKNDDDNYSTMMSTVDLRTRAPSVATGLSTK
jgi:hypothetical protein